MSALTADAIFELIDHSWPPEAAHRAGPWIIRKDSSGSKRAMAASAVEPATPEDLGLAEAQMEAMGQPLLFQIRGPGGALDQMLDSAGYAVIDRCTIYAIEAKEMVADIPPARAWCTWEPLAAQMEIWDAGGIGPGRIAIMHRTTGLKTAILGRAEDSPAGTAFVSAHKDLAMIHAVETLARFRRRGVARLMMQRAAGWCVANGVRWLTLITTDDNGPSNALYLNMGMQAVSQYHYRIKDAS